jgi:DNA repair protein RadA/Sms
VKHRFGSTDELGLFEMGERGLAGVPDPSALFLADRRSGVPGSVVVPTLDGNRPLLVEVQALVSTAGPQGARRSAQGIDPGRLALLIAVLEQRVGLSRAGLDVYVSVAGGVRITEPGSDLAIALAIASALTGHALPSDLVALGEIGLAGELRQARRRPAASARRSPRLRSLVVPESTLRRRWRHVPRAPTLATALDLVGLGLGAESVGASW